MADECKAWQITCHLGSAASKVVDQASTSVIRAWSDGVLEALDSFVTTLSTWWLRIPAPSLSGDGSVLPWVSSVTGFATAAIAVGSLIVAGILLMVHQRGEDLRKIAWGMLMMVMASGTVMAVMTTAIGLGDEFSSWVLSEATQGEVDHFMTRLLDISFITAGAPGTPLMLLLIIGLVGLVANIVQAVLMLVRSAMLVLLVGMIPLAAAASVTGWGQAWLRKTFGWAVAFVLFKPVASLIYAIGIRLVANDSAQADSGDVLYSLLLGVVMLVLATLSLPALVSFMVPAAAGMGGGGAFAAGAAVGGTMASGAVNVSAEPRGSAGVNAAASGSGGAGAGGDQASGAQEGATTTASSGSDGERGAAGPSGAGSTGQDGQAATGSGAAGAQGEVGSVGASAGSGAATGASEAVGAGGGASGAAAAGAGAATGGVGAAVVKGAEAAKGAADASTRASDDAVRGSS